MERSPDKQITTTEFEERYTRFVVNLFKQSQLMCHGPEWAKNVAPQLVDLVVADSGMDRAEVQKSLNDIWVKVSQTRA